MQKDPSEIKEAARTALPTESSHEFLAAGGRDGKQYRSWARCVTRLLLDRQPASRRDGTQC